MSLIHILNAVITTIWAIPCYSSPLVATCYSRRQWLIQPQFAVSLIHCGLSSRCEQANQPRWAINVSTASLNTLQLTSRITQDDIIEPTAKKKYVPSMQLLLELLLNWSVGKLRIDSYALYDDEVGSVFVALDYVSIGKSNPSSAESTQLLSG